VELLTTIIFLVVSTDFFGEKASIVCMQSADKDQQESRAVAAKPHETVIKLQRHRAVFPAIVRLSCKSSSLPLYAPKGNAIVGRPLLSPDPVVGWRKV